MIGTEDISIELIDFTDLINNTLSNNFIEKWRYRYSEKLIKAFQLKILESLKNNKPLKIEHLYNYLTKKCNYSKDIVIDFIETIDIEFYNPVITGSLYKLKKNI